MTTRREMCENAANRLQREAYEIQMKGRATPLKQFIPCEKGLVYTAAISAGNKQPQMVITQNAYFTHCTCHPNMTMSELMSYEVPGGSK